MRQFIKENIPGAKYLWRKYYAFYLKRRSKNTKKVFEKKFKNNGWGSDESISGFGSELKQTGKLIEELPRLANKYQINSFLDLPCGDFNWMQHVTPFFKSYYGADIVKDIIIKNQKRYSGFGKFIVLDLLKDNLPEVDILFCRDCLVHLSYADIRKAIRNIKGSNIKYIMTTTYPQRNENKDILTGDWRMINFQIAPFFFPEPIEIFVEGSTERDGAYKDKSMALWRVSDIPNF